MIKLLQKLRFYINNLRQNRFSKKRKKELALTTHKSKVQHLTPTVKCTKKWYGNSYGGFYINPELLSKNSIIYSFGIGKDVSFDKACIKNHGCRVFGFDPTPKSIKYIQDYPPSKLFSFFNYGISEKTSGIVPFFLPTNPKATSGSLLNTEVVNSNNTINVTMKTFKDITSELKHKHIDVLKMDIEGAEYDVLANILTSEVTIDQILVEFHDRLFNLETFKSTEITKKMQENGYHIFACSISYEEVSFIHERKLN